MQEGFRVGHAGEHSIEARHGSDAVAYLRLRRKVSGASFLTLIQIGRWAGADQLGVYSMAFSLIVAWSCVQDSLVSLPYTIYRHRSERGTPAEFAAFVNAEVVKWGRVIKEAGIKAE